MVLLIIKWHGFQLDRPISSLDMHFKYVNDNRLPLWCLERPTWSGEWPVIGMTEFIHIGLALPIHWQTIDQLKQYQKSSVNMNKDNYKSNASKTTAFVMLPNHSHIDKTEERPMIYYIHIRYCRESRQLQYCSNCIPKIRNMLCSKLFREELTSFCVSDDLSILFWLSFHILISKFYHIIS